MAKEKMVFFRSALGGFNREDVNNYIEKLNAEFTERERTAKKKLEAAEEKCAELENIKAQLDTKLLRLAELEAEAEQREKLITEYIGKIEEQTAEIQSLHDSKCNAESEIDLLSAKLESLSDAIQKSEKYDDISAQIGEIILSARSTAEEIISNAEKEADAKRAAVDAQMENAAASFNARAATAAYAIKGQMKKLARDSYASIAEKAAETSDMLRNLAAHINTSDELNNTLSNGKTDAESAIEAEAAKVFTNENRLNIKE